MSAPLSMTPVASSPVSLLPSSLSSDATGMLLVNPVLDLQTSRTVDGPAREGAALPPHHVRNHTTRRLVEAWTLYSETDEVALGAALDAALTCPISHAPFVRPVIAGDGYIYEDNAIRQWLVSSSKSPMTRARIDAAHLWPAVRITQLMQAPGMLDPDAAIPSADLVISATSQTSAAAREDTRVAEDLAAADSAVGHSHLQAYATFNHARRLCNSKHVIARSMGRSSAIKAIAALSVFVEALGQSPVKELFVVWSADCYRFIGQHDTALVMLRAAICDLPHEPIIKSRLALMYAIKGDTAVAKRHLQGCQISGETGSYVHAVRGELARRQGRFLRAEASFDAADAGEVCLREVDAWRKLARKQKAHVAQF